MTYTNKKSVNGREIQFNDTIHHHTETKYDWKDRIRILFGRISHTHSEIYTKEWCNVAGSEATVRVSPLFKRKPRVMGLSSIDKTNNNNGKN